LLGWGKRRRETTPNARESCHPLPLHQGRGEKGKGKERGGRLGRWCYLNYIYDGDGMGRKKKKQGPAPSVIQLKKEGRGSKNLPVASQPKKGKSDQCSAVEVKGKGEEKGLGRTVVVQSKKGKKKPKKKKNSISFLFGKKGRR